MILTGFDELACYCGATVIFPPVPCGTKPPECDRPCTRRHDCDHKVIHNCHSEPQCPPCTFLTSKWCYGQHTVVTTVYQFLLLLFINIVNYAFFFSVGRAFHASRQMFVVVCPATNLYPASSTSALKFAMRDLALQRDSSASSHAPYLDPTVNIPVEFLVMKENALNRRVKLK